MSDTNKKNLPFFSTTEFSPMTEISKNLSVTKISKVCGARKRRLSLSDEENCVNFSENFTDLENLPQRKCFQDITNYCSPAKRMQKTSTMTSSSLLDGDPSGEISFYGGATPETRSPDCSPEIPKKFTTSDHSFKSSRSLFNSGSPLELSSSGRSLFRGLSDFEHSKDDEFMLLEVDDLDENEKLPTNFTQLVSGNILAKTSPENNKTPKVRNRLFDDNNSQTPLTCKQRTSPLKFPLKRSKSLFDNETMILKRSKTEVTHPVPLPPLLRRSISTNCSPNTEIMSAVYRSTIEPDLIGDFSKPFILPLVTSGQRHQDLKSITAYTLSKLIQGDFNETVQSFKIIDCRYPYEYDGGHIKGAINYFTKEQIENELFKTNMNTSNASNKRDIIIFHCEFSAQRGPKLFRYLRALDRNYNNDIYPALYYPEIYLLEGGYKRFFEQFSELCEPIAYKRMDDPAHEMECRLFRAQKRHNSCANIQFESSAQASSLTPSASDSNLSSMQMGARKLLTKRSALEF